MRFIPGAHKLDGVLCGCCTGMTVSTTRDPRSRAVRAARGRVVKLTVDTTTAAKTNTKVKRRNDPVGLTIPSAFGNTSDWVVGRLIGTGAEKIVHLLQNSETKEQYAIKLVPTAARSGSRPSERTTNAASLKREFKLMHNQLQSLQGICVPALPPQNNAAQPRAYGENEQGWNYAVVELMSCQILELIPNMVSDAQSRGDDAVDLAPWVRALLENCRLTQALGVVNVDIKPENIMVSARGKMCWVDWGLMQLLSTKENPHGAGTPAFMACTAHRLSPSSREDVESTLYVMVEVVLRTQACIRGEKELKALDATYLPWDLDASEAEVLATKEKHLRGKFKSVLYETMLPHDAGTCIQKALELNWKCKFNEAPKYDKLISILSALKVPLDKENRDPSLRRSGRVSAALSSAVN